MTIRDFCLLDNNWLWDTIKIRKYSPEHGSRTVLEETRIGSVHPDWLKFKVRSFSLIQHETDKSVCIIAYIKEGDKE